MIDDVRRVATIGVVGREDRALLRSNPSVRSDAGTWAGASARRRLLSSSPCSGSEALNLGVWGRAPTPRRGESTPTGLPYGNIEGAFRTRDAPGSQGLTPLAKNCRLFEAKDRRQIDASAIAPAILRRPARGPSKRGNCLICGPHHTSISNSRSTWNSRETRSRT